MNTPSDQGFLRYPLTRVLGSPGNLRVLRALLSSSAPRGAVPLAEATGLSPPGVRHVLGSLERARVVRVDGSGRSVVYSANADHPLLPALRQLFAAERARWTRLRDAIRKVLDERPAVRAAWYYGSVARGEDEPGSDFDLALFIAGAGVDKVLAGVRRQLRPIEDEFGITCSVVGLSASDVARHVAGGAPTDAWWGSMLRDAKVLKGPHPEQLSAGRDKTVVG
jgi:DNA-binding transcriptional ArsR family regulator